MSVVSLISRISSMLAIITIVFGAVGIGLIAHELTHYIEIRENSYVSDVCILNLPLQGGLDGAGGYVRYRTIDEDVYTGELHSNIVGGIVSILLMICVGNYLSKLQKEGKQ